VKRDPVVQLLAAVCLTLALMTAGLTLEAVHLRHSQGEPTGVLQPAFRAGGH